MKKLAALIAMSSGLSATAWADESVLEQSLTVGSGVAASPEYEGSQRMSAGSFP